MPEIKLIYQQIKEYIENELKTKVPGEYLNSEVQYSSLFNVSRPTVRKAVDELIEAGRVRRIPGKGLMAADGKKSRQSGILLILIPYIPDDGFFYNMVMGCIEAANKAGFGYKILNFSLPDKRLQALKEMDLGNYAGAVLPAYENEFDYKLLKLFETNHLPFVLVDNPIKGFECPCVITDDFKGGYLSADYLLKKGHKKILYLTLESDNQTVRLREKGFRTAFKDHGAVLPEENVIYLKEDEETTKYLVDRKIDYTALCGYSDLPVIIAYNLLSGRDIRVPDRVSLLGYGNFKYSEMLKVPLSTIAMPVYSMGYQAVEMASGIIKGQKKGERKVLDVTLIERDSVAGI